MDSNRTVENCRFRISLGVDAPTGLAECQVVGRVTGVSDPAFCTVTRETCEACCQSLASGDNLNPVVASLIYRAAGAIVARGERAARDIEAAKRVRARIVNHLEVIHPGLRSRCFPPSARRRTAAVEHYLPHAGRKLSRLNWQIGLITAPRAAPTIERALESLEAAGFGRPHIFAEPRSWIPSQAKGHALTVHETRLGNFANFYSSLATLYEGDPGADCFALFQDDIHVAGGTRAWCDAQLWPLDAGLVSLFTAKVNSDIRPGWRLLSPGYWRVFGGQALLFRRDVLERFLSDPQILYEFKTGAHNDDAVVGGWAARHGLAIAYHTPSLVQHVGMVSSLSWGGPDRRVVADAVDSVDRIAAWRAPARPPGKIGLVGWHVANGLGYQAYEIARNLELDRWLIPRHPHAPLLPTRNLKCRTDIVPSRPDKQALHAWFDGLDWLLFIQHPYLPRLIETARARQVNIACIPNWEWLHPRCDWLRYVDLMICPTRHTYALICDWKARYGFGWDAIYLPWPADTGRFRFRQRRTCRRFVFVNGWGGAASRRLDGSLTAPPRKGIDLISQVARQAPHLPLIVYSQRGDIPHLPAHVERRPPPADNRHLYIDGEICVQPSHYEGLGLQLLECQAAGMPLITTDAPPMNEHQPLDTIPVIGAEIVQLFGDQPIASHLMTPAALIAVMERWLGADISDASRSARAYVEREHSWSRARDILREKLVAY